MTTAPAGLRLRFSGADDMRRTVNNSGTSHWFSPDTMRWFSTRIGETLYGPGGRVFVTSERNPSGVRRFSIRVLCDNDGSYSVQTVGAFGAYASRNGAHRAAQRVAAGLALWAVGNDVAARYIDDASAERLAQGAGVPLVSAW